MDTDLRELLLRDVLSEARSMCDKLNQDLDKLSPSAIRMTAMPFIRALCEQQATRRLVREMRMRDRFTYRHCIGVAVLSFGIGVWSGMDGQRLQELVIAGFLHDIGRMKLPDSILLNPGPLTQDEHSEMCLHTFMGFDMLRGLPGLTEQQAQVALQHHEREDGSGYPFGLSGDQIAVLSKVVAIADAFHAMISERDRKPPMPLYQALSVLYDITVDSFDARLVRCFVSNMMKRAIDSKVLLSNGQAGRIVKLHADDPIHPTVSSRGKLIDLRKSSLRIVDFMGGSPYVRTV